MLLSGRFQEVHASRRNTKDMLRLMTIAHHIIPFAVNDGRDRSCTRADFLSWAELQSSFMPIPKDNARYERVVGECWGIPAQRHTTPGSLTAVVEQERQTDSDRFAVWLVVTHANGSTSFERVHIDSMCDGSLTETQAHDARRQLADRGIHAIRVRLLDSASSSQQEEQQHAVTPAMTAHEKPATCPESPAKPLKQSLTSQADLRIARLGRHGDKAVDDAPISNAESVSGPDLGEARPHGGGIDPELRRWVGNDLIRRESRGTHVAESREKKVLNDWYVFREVAISRVGLPGRSSCRVQIKCPRNEQRQ